MRVAEAAELRDLHGGTDWVLWAIAVRLRSRLRKMRDTFCLEYEGLIWQLYRHIFASRFAGRPPERGTGKLVGRRLARVIDYIEENLADSTLSISALANVASLSPFHFLRSFQRTLYMTPYSFVRARRFDRIRVAIAHGDRPAEAARRFGFTHISHFRAEYAATTALPQARK